METKKLLEHRRLIKSRKPKFLRKDWHKVSNLGLRRESKQVWRKPKGRHNKLREKKKNRGKNPSVGYRSPKQIRGTINGLFPVLVKNVKELENVGKNNIAIIAKVGLRKKIEIVKKADEMKITVAGNTKKILKNAEKKIKERADKKKQAKKQEKEQKKEESKPESKDEKKEQPTQKSPEQEEKK